jgi:Cu/Ag efflux pump CusA
VSSDRYVFLHQGARRVQTITCNVQGRAVDSFIDEAQKRISRLSFPSDTYVEFFPARARRKHNPATTSW